LPSALPENESSEVESVKSPLLMAEEREGSATVQEDKEQKPSDEKLPSKGAITDQMDKLDDEISKYEDLLEALKRKKQEGVTADESASKRKEKAVMKKLSKSAPRLNKFVARSWSGMDYADLTVKIYRENRAKAKKANTEGLLPPLNYDIFSNGKPLYSCPEDLPFYQENIDTFNSSFKQVLMLNMSNRKKALREKEVELRERYDQLEDEFLMKVTKWEAHMRKKQVALEMKLSSKSTSTRPRDIHQQNSNDYIFPYINLKPQTEEDFRYVKTLAVVPNMILDEKERESSRYIDCNRILDDNPGARLRHAKESWSEEEKMEFIIRFLEYPKEFGQIARFIPNKSTQDCVLFYYLNKKEKDFKGKLKEAIAERNRSRRRRKNDNYEESRSLNSPTMETDEYRRAPVNADALRQSLSRQSEQTRSKPIPDEEKNWSAEEVRRAKDAFLQFGRDFIQVAQVVGTKTVYECRLLFTEYRRRHQKDLTEPDMPPSAETEMDSQSRKQQPPIASGRKKRISLTSRSRERSHDDTQDEEMSEREGARKGRRGRKRVTDDEDVDMASPLSPVASTEDFTKKEKRRTVSYWTTKEKADFLEQFKIHGRDWKKIAEFIPAKSEVQIRNYYQNNKVALGLVADNRKSNEPQPRGSSNISMILNGDDSRETIHIQPQQTYPMVMQFPVQYAVPTSGFVPMNTARPIVPIFSGPAYSAPMQWPSNAQPIAVFNPFAQMLNSSMPEAVPMQHPAPVPEESTQLPPIRANLSEQQQDEKQDPSAPQ
jgi:hypothetical protein